MTCEARLDGAPATWSAAAVPMVEKRAVVEEPEVRTDLVVQRMTGASRAVVRGMFDHGCVTVDGTIVDEAGLLVGTGAAVVVKYDSQRRYKEKPRVRESAAFKLVYEDDHILIVDKQPGWLTVPTDDGRKDKTLVEEVRKHIAKGRKDGYVGLVHRLDRGTSGVLAFAKTPAARHALILQFSEKKPLREYVAIVAGHVADDEGKIVSNLVTNERNLDQYSTEVEGEGKIAVTRFRVVERLRGATWLHVELETGRRNQIRVHFAERGHPVLGDDRYEPERARHPAWKEKRLALHAAVLGFVHPTTGTRIVFRSPPPPPFTRFRAAGKK